ncbi:pseudaminic acid biosynthesis-associated protein PseG [Rhizobium leguminosarum bv. trifolii WSM2297]|uniref:Pseudaminic acid biosynthesis-associated protein PseG n=1 Tax=Rhizobium leguminosarum bv. trifolii WSM2297 TaxID=754762 RepID=J0CSG3_RHILT|nr:UDP-2,4-diacetamido-2,4,6-trideoxy-beta-L-altropyranose hydrolase [Rhizobium leguminosarum]EJC82695.1 pseudaminic acid biosynthesis-associated protein PseG [Rhizobium leguminosarum bv. trifolii WSM2297]
MSGNSGVLVFRCDGSISIGSGHMMRCITLAETLRNFGYRSHFICRELEGNLISVVAERGFEVHRLLLVPQPAIDLESTQEEAFHEQADALECREIMKAIQPERVIVDSYALGSGWAKNAVPMGCDVLVIDDLADRPLLCDIVLNQNFGRQVEEYDHLLSSGCKRLIGPLFALIRPEFAQARSRSLSRRRGQSLQHLLIAFGATDPDNCSGKVLAYLLEQRPFLVQRITIVLGAQAPHFADVLQRARTAPIPVDVLSGVADMAELLVGCDAAIGAAGTSVWERCVLGVPSLLLTFAENQRAGMIALDAAYAGIALGDAQAMDWQIKLRDALTRLSDPDVLNFYSERASTICEGVGAERVAHVIMSQRLILRDATLDDAPAIWNWRRGGGAERYYRSPQRGDINAHIAWFRMALEDRKRHLLIFEVDSVPVGHIRLDRSEDGQTAEVSICIDLAHRGTGLGARALGKALDFAQKQGIKALYAEIHHDNFGSLKVFRGLQFDTVEESTPFLRLRLVL